VSKMGGFFGLTLSPLHSAARLTLWALLAANTVRDHVPAADRACARYVRVHRYYVEMVLANSSAEATGVVAQGDILEVVDEKSTRVRVSCCYCGGKRALPPLGHAALPPRTIVFHAHLPLCFPGPRAGRRGVP